MSKISRSFLFVGLIFSFSLPYSASAEITVPYTIDEKSRVLFGDSVQVGSYYGLENYTASYVGDYLHITYTVTHGQGGYASYPPLLYIRSENPAVFANTAYLYLGLVQNPNSNPNLLTDVYFVDIQFSATGYQERVERGVGRTLISDDIVEIDGMNYDTFIALANYYPLQDPTTDYSMSFTPKRLVGTEPSKIITFDISTSTGVATVHNYISSNDIGAEINFSISSSTGVAYTASKIIATTSGDFYYSWKYPALTDPTITRPDSYDFRTSIVKNSVILREQAKTFSIYSPIVGYPGYSNFLSGSSEQIQSSFNYIIQSLGTGLSGTLTQIDVNTSNPSAGYYGNRPVVYLYECDDDSYGNFAAYGSGCSMIYTGISENSSQLLPGIQSFYTGPVELNPSKYYYFQTAGNNIFNSLPIYYGSNTDVVDGGCMQRISSLSVYMPCTDIADLYFYLRGVTKAEVITGNSNIMFFPGIMGSRLYEESGSIDCLDEWISDECFFDNEKWVSKIDLNQARLTLDNQGKSLYPLYTKDNPSGAGVIDEILTTNIYKSFMSDLDKWKNEEKIIVDYALIPYDWRLSLDDIITKGATTTRNKLVYTNSSQVFSDSYILKKLQEIQKSSPTGKITLIGHSNGGLVIKALVQKLKDTNNPLYNKIDKIIFVAVPQVGTPEAVATILHGSSLGHGVIMTDQRSRQLVENMPSIYNLLPSASYFTTLLPGFVSNTIASFPNNPLFNADLSKYGSYVDNQTEMNGYILGTDGRVKPSYSDTVKPSIGNSTLLTQAQSVHATLDSWTPASTTKVIQIAGWGEETLAGIDYSTSGSKKTSFKLRNVVDGDGTVVVPSALWMATSTPDVERWWVDLIGYDTLSNIERLHRDILEVPNLRSLIKSKIINAGYIDNDSIVVNNPIIYTTKKLRLHYTLHSPLTLGISDNQGKYTGLDPITYELREEIPGVTHKQIGDVKYISVPKELAHSLKLKGYEAGDFSLDIDEQEGNNLTELTSFDEIPTSTTTVVMLNYSPNYSIASSTLDIDFDGNGIIDLKLNAKIGEVVRMPTYKWEGFLQPVNDIKYHPEQSQSVFKTGSTIPVKFQLKKFDGTIVQAEIVPKWQSIEKLSALSSPIDESIYSLSATSGTDFKWDSTNQQYIYNWSTKGLPSGYWYKISVKLDDGIVYSVIIGLR